MRSILRRILTSRRTAIVLAVIVIAVAFLPDAIQHNYGCDWTGFGACTPTGGELRPEKTLWDWLDLLIVPAVLAIVGLVFTRQERANENRLADERTKADRAIADQRTADERVIAAQRFQDETLRTYLDQMTELLLDKGLRTSEPGAEVRDVARVRTLIALRRLDQDRRNIVIQFLRDSKLVGLEDSEKIVNFDRADLSNAELTGIDLRRISLTEAKLTGANFSGAKLTGTNLDGAYLDGANLIGAKLIRTNLIQSDLNGADLSGAILGGAKLTGANLIGAKLIGAKLTGANLIGAYLDGAYLTGADLIQADLSWADLTGAILRGARISDTQLKQAASLSGTTLPNGQTYKSEAEHYQDTIPPGSQDS